MQRQENHERNRDPIMRNLQRMGRMLKKLLRKRKRKKAKNLMKMSSVLLLYNLILLFTSVYYDEMRWEMLGR